MAGSTSRYRNPSPGLELAQAVDLAGGTKVLHGKVEFMRFMREGEIDRRIFGFEVIPAATTNPVLMSEM